MEYRAMLSRPLAHAFKAAGTLFLLCPNFAPNPFPIRNIARCFQGRWHMLSRPLAHYSFFVRISPQIHSRYGISRDAFQAVGTCFQGRWHIIPSLSEFRPKSIPDMEYRAMLSRPLAHAFKAAGTLFLLCPNFAPNPFPIRNIARCFQGRWHMLSRPLAHYSFFVRISPQIHSRYGISRDAFQAVGTCFQGRWHIIPSLSEFRPKSIPDMEYRAMLSRPLAHAFKAAGTLFLLCPNFAPNPFPIWNIARCFQGRWHMLSRPLAHYSFFVRISPQIHSRYGISRDAFKAVGTCFQGRWHIIPSLSEFRPKSIPDMEYRAMLSRPLAHAFKAAGTLFLLCPNFAPNPFPIRNIARCFQGRWHMLSRPLAHYSFFVRISPQIHSRYGI